MASNIENKIDRIAAAKEAIAAAIAGKGVTVPDGTLIDGMAALIESIEAGGGGGINIETFTFIPAATGASDFFSFDKTPFFVVCIRKNFEYYDAYDTDKYETPFCASIIRRYNNGGNQQLISLYNNSSSYFSGAVYKSNSTLSDSTQADSYSPVCFRWSESYPCYFNFYTGSSGGRGLRVGEEYTVIVVFKEDVT